MISKIKKPKRPILVNDKFKKIFVENNSCNIYIFDLASPNAALELIGVLNDIIVEGDDADVRIYKYDENTVSLAQLINTNIVKQKMQEHFNSNASLHSSTFGKIINYLFKDVPISNLNFNYVKDIS